MPSLILGPLVRHAGETDATIWVETDGACTVRILDAEARTFCVGGHHYALVLVEGLEPGSRTPYAVHLDDDLVWPLPDGDWPPSVIPTWTEDAPVDIVFGSCRTAYPHEPPFTLRKDQHARGREVCALRALALRLRDQPAETWPGALLHLGDQIYADEVDPETKARIAGEEIADFEEYTRAYAVSWSEPAIRWLLSTVPSAMIFDDHDVIDDWNTSHAWLTEIRQQPWWHERIVGAFVSYWVYQHIGNLSPSALADDELYQQVCGREDALETLRAFAERADREVNGAQWSFCRQIGPARLIMIDSRAGRVLEPDRRAMVDDAEWDFIARNGSREGARHVLLGTSLPWLLAPGMHHLEAFNEAVAQGAWGRLAARVGERVRQAVDMEHWAAFNESWRELTDLVTRIGSADRPPATVIALSGDVHHAYLAEVSFDDPAVRSRVYQAVCSPFRNPLDQRERRIIKFASSAFSGRIMGALARAAGVPRPHVDWRLRRPAVFDNVVATLRLHGDFARLTLERARPSPDGRDVQLDCVFRGDV